MSNCRYISSIARAEDQLLPHMPFQWWWFTVPMRDGAFISLELFVRQGTLGRFLVISYNPRASTTIIDDLSVKQKSDSVLAYSEGRLVLRLTCDRLVFFFPEMIGSLRFRSTLAWSVGLADSLPIRRSHAVPFVWTVPGAQVKYSGFVLRKRFVQFATDELYGYRDRNFGKDYTRSWRWLSTPSLIEIPWSTQYEHENFKSLWRKCSAQARGKRPRPETAMVVGGQETDVLNVTRANICLLWLEGKSFSLVPYELGHHQGFQDFNVEDVDDELAVSFRAVDSKIEIIAHLRAPRESFAMYPILDGAGEAVYNDVRQTSSQLLQSCAAHGLVQVRPVGQAPRLFLAPLACIEVGDRDLPRWYAPYVDMNRVAAEANFPVPK